MHESLSKDTPEGVFPVLRSASTSAISEGSPDSQVCDLARLHLNDIRAELTFQMALVLVDHILQVGPGAQYQPVFLVLCLQWSTDLRQLSLHIADEALCHSRA